MKYIDELTFLIQQILKNMAAAQQHNQQNKEIQKLKMTYSE